MMQWPFNKRILPRTSRRTEDLINTCGFSGRTGDSQQILGRAIGRVGPLFGTLLPLADSSRPWDRRDEAAQRPVRSRLVEVQGEDPLGEV